MFDSFVGLFPSRHDTASNNTLSAHEARDELSIGHLHFNNVTWLASHNAHANRFAAGDNALSRLASNQEYSIYRQLKEVGVRGLMLDLEYDIGSNEIRLVHGFVAFSSLRDTIQYEIAPFLDEDADAIVTLDLETMGNNDDRALIMKELRTLLREQPGFTNKIFRLTDDRWANHTEWPTIQEMRDADQRVIVFSDSTIVQSVDFGVMLRGDVCLQNHWKRGLDGCSPRNGWYERHDIPWGSRTIRGKPWTRLFLLSHFCCAMGTESLRRVQPDRIGGGDNGWGVLYPRVVHCMEESGNDLKPNYIAVDWAHVGDTHEVVDYLKFGGRLGTGQPCHSGLDCATGSCSATLHRCQCQICDNCTSGCAPEETCTSIQDGLHECVSNASGDVINALLSSGAESLYCGSPLFIILPVMFLLKLMLGRHA